MKNENSYTAEGLKQPFHLVGAEFQISDLVQMTLRFQKKVSGLVYG